ncbi:MAG: DUF2339 domain-containing protein [Mariprofundaceae bacterium]|nr:DUF2339 domain-containing protein [Mariprofundaceae bacterium]
MSSQFDQIEQEIENLKNTVNDKTQYIQIQLSQLKQAHAHQQQDKQSLKEQCEHLQDLLQSSITTPPFQTKQEEPTTIQQHKMPQIPQTPPEKMPTPSKKTPITPPKATTINHAAPTPESISPKPLESYLSILLNIFAPLSQVISKVSIFAHIYEQLYGIFKHYQKQEKTTVFFMVVAGLILVVTGFAYLLQMNFTKLSIEWKITCGFITAATVTALGIWLYQRRNDMQDYAAALIGLGLVLAYVCAYFMGTTFNLVHDSVSFAVLAFLTLFAYVLALFFNTRIVALVSLIGGACLPLLGESQGWLILSYSGYLVFLNISSLHLSHKIRWTTLSYIAFGLSAVMLEYQFSHGLKAATNIEMLWLAFTFHAFYYLYLLYSYNLLNTAAKAKGMLLITSNMALFIVLMTQLLEASMLSFFLIANAICLSFIFIKQIQQQNNTRASLLLLQAGLFLALAILNWIDASLMGVLWGAEGLLLLYMGFYFNTKSIRYEAYILLFIALSQAAWQSQFLFTVSSWSASNAWVYGIVLLSIGIVMQAIRILLQHYRKQLFNQERKLSNFIAEATSVWIIVATLISTEIIHENYYLWSIIPLILFLLERSARLKLAFTENIACLLYLLPLLQIFSSGSNAGSFMFSDMPWNGQLAYLEAITLLWIISTFYLKRYPQSSWVKWAKPMLTCFYLLLPIILLPKAYRLMPLWFPAIVWISAISVFALHRWRKDDVFYREQVFLTIIAIAFSLHLSIFNGQASLIHLIIAYAAGLCYFFIILSSTGSLFQRYNTQGYQVLRSTAFYYAVGGCFLLSIQLFSSFLIALFTLQCFAAYIIWQHPVFQPLRTHLTLWYLSVLAIPVLMLFTTLIGQQRDYLIVLWLSVAISLVFTHIKRPHFKVLHHLENSHIGQLLFSHSCLFAIYSITSLLWFENNFQVIWSILMVTHATVMLFESLWPRYACLLRASIALYAITAIKIIIYDLHDFSMTEKVIAFIIIGSILLFSAYWFQRLKNHLTQRITT